MTQDTQEKAPIQSPLEAILIPQNQSCECTEITTNDKTSTNPVIKQKTDIPKKKYSKKNSPKDENVKLQETAVMDNTGLALLCNGFLDFQPSAGMIRLVNATIYDNQDNLSPPALCEKIGLTRQAWYNFKRDNKFISWYQAVQYESIKLKLPDLYRSLYNRGSITDTAAAKIIIERFDPMYKSDQNINLNVKNAEMTKEDKIIAGQLAEQRIKQIVSEQKE